MRVRDQFCSDGERLPWIDFPPGILPAVTRTQLYRFHYERLSNRQQKKMDFDGMIGSIWLKGDGLQQLAPLVEAAEILHIGQKATFGLGLVRGSRASLLNAFHDGAYAKHQRAADHERYGLPWIVLGFQLFIGARPIRESTQQRENHTDGAVG